jgi:hypothetical protein
MATALLRVNPLGKLARVKAAGVLVLELVLRRCCRRVPLAWSDIILAVFLEFSSSGESV